MIELSYITTTAFNHLTEEPGRLITVLEYACVCILLAAMITDSILRRRRARQKSILRDKPGMHFAVVTNHRRDSRPSSSR